MTTNNGSSIGTIGTTCTGTVSYFNLKRFEGSVRSYGFAIAKIGGRDVKVHFGTDNYRKPIGEADGVYTATDNSENVIKTPPKEGQLIAFQLGENAAGPCAEYWCWEAQRQAATHRHGKLAAEEQVASEAREAQRKADQEAAEAAAMEAKRLRPTDRFMARKYGWKETIICGTQVVMTLLDPANPGKNLGSRTFHVKAGRATRAKTCAAEPST